MMARLVVCNNGETMVTKGIKIGDCPPLCTREFCDENKVKEYIVYYEK